jgi:hypothetical protein
LGVLYDCVSAVAMGIELSVVDLSFG